MPPPFVASDIPDESRTAGRVVDMYTSCTRKSLPGLEFPKVPFGLAACIAMNSQTHQELDAIGLLLLNSERLLVMYRELPMARLYYELDSLDIPSTLIISFVEHLIAEDLKLLLNALEENKEHPYVLDNFYDESYRNNHRKKRKALKIIGDIVKHLLDEYKKKRQTTMNTSQFRAALKAALKKHKKDFKYFSF